MSDHKRRFTVAEANELLPQLERLLKRLRGAYRRAKERHKQLLLMQSLGTREDGTMVMAYDYRRTRQAFRRAVNRVNTLIEQVQTTGATIRNVDLGLIDFPFLIDEQEAHLCWKLGDGRVQYYHTPDMGYPNRRPLPDSLLNTQGQDPS